MTLITLIYNLKDSERFGIMTKIIRVFRVIRVERMNAPWYKPTMNIYLL